MNPTVFAEKILSFIKSNKEYSYLRNYAKEMLVFSRWRIHQTTSQFFTKYQLEISKSQ